MSLSFYYAPDPLPLSTSLASARALCTSIFFSTAPLPPTPSSAVSPFQINIAINLKSTGIHSKRILLMELRKEWYR
jgi:hypothetical protein